MNGLTICTLTNTRAKKTIQLFAPALTYVTHEPNCSNKKKTLRITEYHKSNVRRKRYVLKTYSRTLPFHSYRFSPGCPAYVCIPYSYNDRRQTNLILSSGGGVLVRRGGWLETGGEGVPTATVLDLSRVLQLHSLLLLGLTPLSRLSLTHLCRCGGRRKLRPTCTPANSVLQQKLQQLPLDC